MAKPYKAGFIILTMGILGLILSAVVQVAYDNQLLIHLYMEAADLPGFQIVLIVVFLLLGGVLAALSS